MFSYTTGEVESTGVVAASEVDAQDLRLEVDETVADPAFRAQVGGCAWVLKLFFPSLVGRCLSICMDCQV